MKLSLAKFLVGLAFFAIAVSPILAQGNRESAPPFAAQAIESPSATPLKTPNPGVVRSCQARENSIKTRMTHLTQLATDMLSTFASIAQGVEDYYNSKVVPSGKTVPNYDTLVADIQTKNTAVTTALSKAQTDVNGFSCTTGDPKGDITQFRTDMQAAKSALKAYRTSIKNLIVAVRGKAGQLESPSPSASPLVSPTSTP